MLYSKKGSKRKAGNNYSGLTDGENGSVTAGSVSTQMLSYGFGTKNSLDTNISILDLQELLQSQPQRPFIL